MKKPDCLVGSQWIHGHTLRPRTDYIIFVFVLCFPTPKSIAASKLYLSLESNTRLVCAISVTDVVARVTDVIRVRFNQGPSYIANSLSLVL